MRYFMIIRFNRTKIYMQIFVRANTAAMVIISARLTPVRRGCVPPFYGIPLFSSSSIYYSILLIGIRCWSYSQSKASGCMGSSNLLPVYFLCRTVFHCVSTIEFQHIQYFALCTLFMIFHLKAETFFVPKINLRYAMLSP